MRAFSASFSSRAAAAIALTASNSSRPTKSRRPSIRASSRAPTDSASRPMPAMVPAKPFTIFTKSSNILFSDCIGKFLPFGAEIGVAAASATLGPDYPQLPEISPDYPSRAATCLRQG